MSHFVLKLVAAVAVAAPVALASDASSTSSTEKPVAKVDLGVEVTDLSPVIDNPHVSFASTKRAVYEGKERDDETGEMVKVRVEAIVREEPEVVAGVKV